DGGRAPRLRTLALLPPALALPPERAARLRAAARPGADPAPVPPAPPPPASPALIAAPLGGERRTEPRLPAGTVTLLFTDIAGSTHLLQQLGERYADALATHQRLLREAF